MKIKHLSLMILAGIFAVSCSDDDNTPSPAQSITGDYSGYTVMESSYLPAPLTTEDVTVKIVANEDGTVNVTYSNSTISNVEVKVSTAGVYTFSGEGTIALAMGSGDPAPRECTFTGTISADKSEVEIAFTFDFMNNATITFHKGDAPANMVISGSYVGYTDMDSRYFEDNITPDVTITITPNEDGTVNVTFNELMGEEDKVLFVENTFSNMEVNVGTDGAYTLSSDGVFAMMGMGGAANNYDCTFTGTISADKSAVEFIYSIPAVMGGTTITFNLGDAPATQE